MVSYKMCRAQRAFVLKSSMLHWCKIWWRRSSLINIERRLASLAFAINSQLWVRSKLIGTAATNRPKSGQVPNYRVPPALTNYLIQYLSLWCIKWARCFMLQEDLSQSHGQVCKTSQLCTSLVNFFIYASERQVPLMCTFAKRPSFWSWDDFLCTWSNWRILEMQVSFLIALWKESIVLEEWGWYQWHSNWTYTWDLQGICFYHLSRNRSNKGDFCFLEQTTHDMSEYMRSMTCHI